MASSSRVKLEDTQRALNHKRAEYRPPLVCFKTATPVYGIAIIGAAPLPLAPGSFCLLAAACFAPEQEKLQREGKAPCRGTGKANEERGALASTLPPSLGHSQKIALYYQHIIFIAVNPFNLCSWLLPGYKFPDQQSL